MTEISLKCNCGTIQGVASSVTANSGTRIVCHCDDCQAFAHYLDSENLVLDEYGGTDIFQMPISYIKITEGIEQIRCIKLSPKGLFRWYTECCKTPIGNTMSAGVPFIGVIHNFMDDAGIREKNLGPVRGYMLMKGALPADRSQTSSFKIIMRIISKMIIWKLKGLNKPSSFFDSNGNPIAEPFILKPNTEN